MGAGRRGAARASSASTELLDVFVERIEKFNPELNAFCYLDLEGARARAAAIDAAVARGEDPGTVGRRADGREGARRGRGLARHARVAALPRRRRRRTTTPSRPGCKAAGAVLVGLTTSPEFGSTELDAHLPARHDPQPVEPRAHARRFVGRFGRRGRVGDDADLHRQRRRRLDPHPVVVQRSVRLQDELRPRRLRRQLRQRAHVGARPDVPLGARRGALRRRDRGPDEQRPDVVAAPGAFVRGRDRLRRRGRAAARQARGLVVDARLRGVRSRGREARVRGRARVVRRRRASSSSTSTSGCRGPAARGA